MPRPKPKIKLNILPEVEDIKYFLIPGTNKSNNDEENKIRENTIKNMFELDDDYFSDSQYGLHWKNIKNKFVTSISTLCEKAFTKIKIKHMGGMNYNYDFQILYLDESNSELETIKLEFKHNNSTVSDLAQFLELYDKDCNTKYNICPTSYSDFYYTFYLDKYLESDPNLKLPKPDKNIYLKHIHDITYKHEFFKHLHENKNNNIKEKQIIANDSVKEYIQQFSATFTFEELTTKIKESHNNKVFLLWDCTNFHIERINVENIKIKKIIKIDKLSFNIEVENFQYNIRIRINWGNSNGLCNPRWKFTFINKE